MDFFREANEAFVDEKYEEALKLYTSAIDADSTVAEYHVKRAQTYMKLEKYGDAEADGQKACELDSTNHKAFLRKGIAQFHLKKYKEALETLKTGSSLNKTDTAFKQWIDRCAEKVPPDPEPPRSEKQEATMSNKEPVKAVDPIPEPPKEKQRFDWYQTETHVIITIMIKGCKKENVDIKYNQRTFSATIRLPSGSDYSLELDLSHPVVPTHCFTRILSTKVECKLKKEEAIRWNKLEGEDTFAKAAPKGSVDATNKYPSSSHHTRNWDKIAKQIEEEDKEEDKGVNGLFQKLYGDGSDEVRKAMNKSFVESGGTVLSTNWEDIGKKKTEMKAPDGMEWKNYEI